MMEVDTEEAENSQNFYKYFDNRVKSLQAQIDQLGDAAMGPTERSTATDNCLSAISKLSNDVNDASSYIPAYDQRAYAQSIKALQARLRQTRAASAPKQKFSFKKGSLPAKGVSEVNFAARGSSAPDSASMPSSTIHTAAASGPAQSKQRSDSNIILLASLRNTRATIPLQPAESSVQANNTAARTVTVRDIKRSIVDLAPPPSPEHERAGFASLTVKDVSASLLLLHRATGPVHLTNVQDSVVVVSCGQFRMHASAGCTVYLACGSRPIIEGCTGVAFAPLPDSLLRRWGLAGGVEGGDSSAAAQTGMWDQVDDFGWLVTGTQSPNWRVLAPAERHSDAVWEAEHDVDQTGGSVESILRAVGLGDK